jgi:hypothetical protein
MVLRPFSVSATSLRGCPRSRTNSGLGLRGRRLAKLANFHWCLTRDGEMQGTRTGSWRAGPAITSEWRCAALETGHRAAK